MERFESHSFLTLPQLCSDLWATGEAEELKAWYSTEILRYCPQSSPCVPFFPINSLSIDGTSNNKWCLPEQGRAGSMLQAEVINKVINADGQLSGQ